VWRLKPRDWRLLDPVNGVMVYLIALALTVIVTYTVKAYAGRLRPCFYAMCNYKGYRDAVDAGNFTDYISQTMPDVIGNIAHCLETDKTLIDESRFSFPSGHSSLSTCAFGFMGLIVTNLLSALNPKFDVLKLPVLVLFLFPAFFIAVTRTREYYHNYSDILAGIVIGLCISVATHTFAYIYSPIFDQTGEDTVDDPYHELSQVTPSDKSE